MHWVFSFEIQKDKLLTFLLGTQSEDGINVTFFMLILVI